MTITPEPETVSKATGGAKGLKSKRILSVREMVGHCLPGIRPPYDMDNDHRGTREEKCLLLRWIGRGRWWRGRREGRRRRRRRER